MRIYVEPIAEHLIGAALDLDDPRLNLDAGRMLILRGESKRALALDRLERDFECRVRSGKGAEEDWVRSVCGA